MAKRKQRKTVVLLRKEKSRWRRIERRTMVSAISLRRLLLLGRDKTAITRLIIKMMNRRRIMMMQLPTQRSVARLLKKKKTRTMMTTMKKATARLTKIRTRLAMGATTKVTGGKTLLRLQDRAPAPTTV